MEGNTASMRRYFYGIKVQLVTTGQGIPVDFHFTVGKQADVKALGKFIYKLPPQASVYADSAYTDYDMEDTALKKYHALINTQRKANAKRKNSKEVFLEILIMRKRIETSISDIKKLFPRSIHAVTLNGFLIKFTFFIMALQINMVF
jgi:hypothetical protein